MRRLALAALIACASPSPEVADDLDLLRGLRLDARPPPDPTNRWADDAAAAELGRALFFDAGLSPAGVACATCHDPARHFTDGRPRARGVGDVARNTPTVIGSQWGPWYAWDGRADSLWSQALGPIESPAEMGSDRVFVARRVAERWADAYEAAFGDRPEFEGLPPRARPAPDHPALHDAWSGLPPETRDAVDGVFARVGKALAAYERRLVPRASAFDRYIDARLAGDPDGGGHLDEAQRRGLRVFLDAGCVRCHSGPLLTDHTFHNLGLPEPSGYDPGRTVGAMLALASPFRCGGPHADADDCPELRYLDPNFPDFVAAFKTPSLRDVALTAPYMHHGGLATLADVVAFYDDLPGVAAAGHRELTLRPLGLTEAEEAELVAFLEALTGDQPGAALSPSDTIGRSEP